MEDDPWARPEPKRDEICIDDNGLKWVYVGGRSYIGYGGGPLRQITPRRKGPDPYLMVCNLPFIIWFRC